MKNSSTIIALGIISILALDNVDQKILKLTASTKLERISEKNQDNKKEIISRKLYLRVLDLEEVLMSSKYQKDIIDWYLVHQRPNKGKADDEEERVHLLKLKENANKILRELTYLKSRGSYAYHIDNTFLELAIRIGGSDSLRKDLLLTYLRAPYQQKLHDGSPSLPNLALINLAQIDLTYEAKRSILRTGFINNKNSYHRSRLFRKDFKLYFK